MAHKYYIVPENYKNKRLLLNAILDYWDNLELIPILKINTNILDVY